MVNVSVVSSSLIMSNKNTEELKFIWSSFHFQMNIISLEDITCRKNSLFTWSCSLTIHSAAKWLEQHFESAKDHNPHPDSVSKLCFLADDLELWEKVSWISVVAMEKSQLKNKTLRKKTWASCRSSRSQNFSGRSSTHSVLMSSWKLWEERSDW